MPTLLRALVALPILLLAPFVIRGITFADPHVSNLAATLRATPSFTVEDQSFRLLNSFYGIPVVDDFFATTTASFSLVHIFPTDFGAYWQSLVFMTEYAGVYALLLLEACRGVNKGRFFGYPLLMTLTGQVIPIGFFFPIWFFAYVVSTPKAKFQTPGAVAISSAHAAAVLPTIILGYHLPNFGALLHPELSARHWWMWVWQLYPVWGSLMFFVNARLLAPLVKGVSSRKIVQFTLVALSLFNAGVHWYTDLNAGFTAYELFVPKFLFEKPEDPQMAMMTILQYDHVIVSAAVILWLLYSLGESTSGGKGRMIGVLVVLGLLTTFGVVSAGTVILLLWELRERTMVADLEAVILKRVDGKKK